MLELRSYDGMRGFADGYSACFRQFKDYIEKEKDPEIAVEKMQNLVDFLEDFTLTQGERKGE